MGTLKQFKTIGLCEKKRFFLVVTKNFDPKILNFVLKKIQKQKEKKRSLGRQQPLVWSFFFFKKKL